MIHKYIPALCFFAISIFQSSSLFCQWIGGNGEGFSRIYSGEDIPALQQVSPNSPLVIRWPGGSDAKLAFPSLGVSGMGMRPDSIHKHYAEFTDENGLVKEEALQKDLKKAMLDAAEPQSALQQLIDVSHQVKNLQVIYCLNVMTGTVESNISALRVLIDSGVNIIAIVAGNETYFSYAYNWGKYVSDFEPILEACKNEFPTVPRLLCIIQSNKRKQHKAWNSALVEYVHAHDDLISGTDVHLYLVDELKEANLLHPKKVVYDPNTFYPELHTAFKKYIELYKADTSISSFLKYYHYQLPGKFLVCSEFGDKPADYWLNTVANGGNTFSIFCRYRNNFQALLVHNLLANWLWAARSPAGKFDACNTDASHINRCHWYAIQMVNEMPLHAEDIAEAKTISEAGTYYFYFNNAGGEIHNCKLKLKQVQVQSAELHFVSGKYTYSSAGQTGFMDRGSKPSCEIQGIEVKTYSEIPEIPANAFGYVKVIAE